MKELFVLAFIFTAPASPNGDEGNAYGAIEQASYRASGLENAVNNYVQQQLKFVPKEVQQIIGNTFLVGKMIQEQKVSYHWTF